jgi:hypothetical protein
MPNRLLQKATKAQTVKRPASKPKMRKANFENQPWYAAAARTLSAARKPDDLRQVPNAPLVPD